MNVWESAAGAEDALKEEGKCACDVDNRQFIVNCSLFGVLPRSLLIWILSL